MKRLFLAIKPDLSSRKALLALQNDLKAEPWLMDRMTDAPPGAELCRWISEPNLHLTLHFLGAITPEKENALQSVFAQEFPQQVVPAASKPSWQLPCSPFSQKLNRLHAFPQWERARVLTLSSLEVHTSLLALWSYLGKRLTEVGIRVENRPFVPHVTLLRFSKPVRLPLRQTLPALAEVNFPVLGFTIFESLPTEKGSQYEALSDFSLAPQEGT